MKKTHLGSMPFLNVNDAINWSKKFDLVTVPELVKLDEAQLMINRAQFSLIKNDGKFAFSNLIDRFDESEIKIHCAGPLTCTLIPNFEFDKYLELLYESIEKIKKRHDKLWVCLDEPSLNFIKIDTQKENHYQQFLKNLEVKIGIHCCDKIKFTQLFPADLDFISVSAFECDPKDFIEWKQGILIWGAINTKNTGQATSHIPDENVMISPECGLGMLDENLANNVLKCLFELS